MKPFCEIFWHDNVYSLSKSIIYSKGLDINQLIQAKYPMDLLGKGVKGLFFPNSFASNFFQEISIKKQYIFDSLSQLYVLLVQKNSDHAKWILSISMVPHHRNIITDEFINTLAHLGGIKTIVWKSLVIGKI